VATPDTEIAEAIAKGAALITQALYRLQPPGAPTTSEDQLRTVWSSIDEYKTVSDVISDLNVMITEAPIPPSVRRKLAYIVGELEAPPPF